MKYFILILSLLIVIPKALAFTAAEAQKLSGTKIKQTQSQMKVVYKKAPSVRAQQVLQKKIIPQIKDYAQDGRTKTSFLLYLKDGCLDTACTGLLVQSLQKLGYTVEPKGTHFFTGEEAFGDPTAESFFQLVLNWDQSS